jgi:endonuclease/exonuclease/phosphatase family metal-dependent hydrolase
VALANGHFFWWTGHHPERVRQVERLLTWLELEAAGRPVVVCGDFNSTPDTPAIALMRRRFASAHAAAHGREPDYTAPAPLLRPEHPIKKAIVQTMSLFANRTLRPWRGTLDYIFVSPGVRVLDCRVVLDQPASGDPTLYASDHFGLAATLEVEAP